MGNLLWVSSDGKYRLIATDNGFELVNKAGQWVIDCSVFDTETNPHHIRIHSDRDNNLGSWDYVVQNINESNENEVILEIFESKGHEDAIFEKRDLETRLEIIKQEKLEIEEKLRKAS